MKNLSGERRIRVHTLCLPVTPNIHEVVTSADQQAVIGLLAKMAVDRSLTSSLSDARDALVNACVDALTAFKMGLSSPAHGALEVCPNMSLLPLYTLALFKSVRTGFVLFLFEGVYNSLFRGEMEISQYDIFLRIWKCYS